MRRIRLCLFCLPACLAAFPAAALINPKYTPVDLVRQSRTVVRLELERTDGKAGLSVKSHTIRKGERLSRLSDGLAVEDEEQVNRAFSGRKTVTGLLFVGEYSSVSGRVERATGAAGPVGVMLIGTVWFGVIEEAGGRLVLGADPADTKRVWAGNDRMLERAVAYILEDPQPAMPVRAGVTWARECEVATIDGAVNGCLAVEPAGGERAVLFVLGEKGDRAFQMDDTGQAFRELTETLRLRSRSKRAVWGDFNSDGLADLASWDGTALRVYERESGGAWGPGGPGLEIPQGCLSLSAGRAGAGAARLVVGTTGRPVLAGRRGDGTLAWERIGSAEGAPLGGPCALADFDGDGVADVAQATAKGVLFYGGRQAAGFDGPRSACDAEAGKPARSVFFGDYDGDGLLDLAAAYEDGPVLFHNLGGGRFECLTDDAGEVAYEGKPGVDGGASFDINNDGREEFALFYGYMAPQSFFSRGFFCFGFAMELGVGGTSLKHWDAVAQGQRGGAVTDFDGDGAQDLALVAADGSVVVWFRSRSDAAALAVTVGLARGEPGPVNVVGYDGKRCLGARTATAVAPAHFGTDRKGSLLLRWRAEDGSERSRSAIVLKPQRVELTASKQKRNETGTGKETP